MKIELKKDIDGNVELHIRGQFICSWGGTETTDLLMTNKDLYACFQWMMEVAVETGQRHGVTELQNTIKKALDIPI